MKRFLFVFFALFTLLSNSSIGIKAYNNELNYLSIDYDEEFDLYAESVIQDYITNYDFASSNSLVLGSGIPVYGTNNSEEYIFPLLQDDNVVGKLVVADFEGEFVSIYNDSDLEVLQMMINIDLTNTPVYFKVDDGVMYAVIGNELYDMRSLEIVDEIAESEYDAQISAESYVVTRVVPATANVQYIGSRPFIKYVSMEDNGTIGYCAAHCVYNIFRNTGHSNYSYSSISSALGYSASMSAVSSYLSGQGFSNQTAAKNIPFDTVRSSITNYSFVMANATYNDGHENWSHWFVIIGYNTSTNMIQYWDPINGEASWTSGSMNTMISADGHTRTWSKGAVYNIAV